MLDLLAAPSQSGFVVLPKKQKVPTPFFATRRTPQMDTVLIGQISHSDNASFVFFYLFYRIMWD